MSKKAYILEQGKDFDTQSFYIHFGFKTRAFAENELKIAVMSVYVEVEDQELKDFLYEEYICNDFAMITESTHLDIYWADTVRDIVSANTTKRKFDYMLSQEASTSTKRTQKDRRLSQTLTENNIIDLSNQGSSSQQDDVDGWKEIMTAHQNTEEDQLSPLHPKLIAAINYVTQKKSTAFKRYTRSLSYQQQCPEDSLYLYKIITTIMNAFYTKPSLLDFSSAHEPSEQDLNINIWGPIIEAIFSNTIVQVKSGDTVLKSFDRKFKIDYRLGVIINQVFIDIANIEVGRKATTIKVKGDHLKLLLEARTIIQKAISSFGFIYPPSFIVTSFHICGIKGDLLQTSLDSPSNFTTKRTSKRVRIPLSPNNSEELALLLQQLMMYKDKVEKYGNLLERGSKQSNRQKIVFWSYFESILQEELEKLS